MQKGKVTKDSMAAQDKKKRRIGSSTSSENMEKDEDPKPNVVITGEEIQDIVKQSINSAMNEMEARLTNLITSKLKGLDTWVASVDDRTTKVEQDLEIINEKLESLDFAASEWKETNHITDNIANTDTVKEIHFELQQLQQNKKELTRWANRNEQYSRRNNIRIKGLPASSDEDPKATVCKFLNNKMSLSRNGHRVQVQPSDIDAAHPLPTRTFSGKPKLTRQEDGSYKDAVVQKSSPSTIPKHSTSPMLATATQNTTTPAPSTTIISTVPCIMIVKFYARDLRDLIVTSRRQLKGTPISISEDLTRMNQQLVQQLSACPRVEQCWFWKGKVLGRLTGQKKTITFDLYDSILTST